MYRQKGIKWDVTARAAPFCFISHNHFVHLLALEFIGTHPAPADVDERRSIIFRGFWINIRFIKTSSLGPVGSLEGEIILFPWVSYIIYDVCHIFSISMGLRTLVSTSVGKNVHNIEMDFHLLSLSLLPVYVKVYFATEENAWCIFILLKCLHLGHLSLSV